MYIAYVYRIFLYMIFLYVIYIHIYIPQVPHSCRLPGRLLGLPLQSHLRGPQRHGAPVPGNLLERGGLGFRV